MGVMKLDPCPFCGCTMVLAEGEYAGRSVYYAKPESDHCVSCTGRPDEVMPLYTLEEIAVWNWKKICGKLHRR